MLQLISRARARATYANVIATLALFVALGGTGYAAATLARNSVGAKQIKQGAVRTSELRDRGVQLADISRSARTSSARSARACRSRRRRVPGGDLVRGHCRRRQRHQQLAPGWDERLLDRVRYRCQRVHLLRNARCCPGRPATRAAPRRPDHRREWRHNPDHGCDVQRRRVPYRGAVSRHRELLSIATDAPRALGSCSSLRPHAGALLLLDPSRERPGLGGGRS